MKEILELMDESQMPCLHRALLAQIKLPDKIPWFLCVAWMFAIKHDIELGYSCQWMGGQKIIKGTLRAVSSGSPETLV